MNNLIITFLLIMSLRANGQLRFSNYPIISEKQTAKSDILTSQPLEIQIDPSPKRAENINYYNLNKNEICKVFGGKIINRSQNPLNIETQDGSLVIIKEALDPTNKWNPIEYFNWSECGNSYGSINLQPNEYIEFEFFVSPGKLKTKARLKFYTGGYIHYSESFDILINEKDFTPDREGLFDEFLNNKESLLFLKFNEWKSK